MSFNNAVPPVEANALSRPSPQHRRALYFLCGLGALYGLGMHLTLPNVGGIGLVLPSNIFTWLFFALPLGIGLYHAADQGYLKFSTTTVWLALAAVLLTVPVLYPHAAPRDAVTRLVGLWAGWLFLVLLQQFTFTSAHRAWLLKLIVLGVTVQALLGYGQYLLFNADNWLHYLVAPHRPVGVFQQPNVMASFLATGLAISAYWLLHPVTSRVQLWRLRGFSQAIDRRYLLLCIPVTTLPLLVVLSSRTGWLAVLVLVLLMLPYALRRESRGLVLGWLLSVLLGVGAGFALAQVGGDTERVAAKATTADPARQDLYQQAWDMFTEQPWVGHGLGRFESAYVAFGARQQALDAEYPSILPNSSHPHNEILFWLAEGGVLALLGLLVVGAVAVRLVWRQPPGLRTAGLMLLLPIALHSQLEHPFYLSTVHWLTLIMVLAYLDGSGPWRSGITLPAGASSVVRMAALIVPMVVGFFMITALHTNQLLNEFQRKEYRELDDLSHVSNSFVWRDRIDWLYYFSGLYIGITTETPEYIQPYIDWSDDILARKPRPQFMQNLIMAHEALGQEQEALATLRQAQRWFPGWEGFGLQQGVTLDTEIQAEEHQ